MIPVVVVQRLPVTNVHVVDASGRPIAVGTHGIVETRDVQHARNGAEVRFWARGWLDEWRPSRKEREAHAMRIVSAPKRPVGEMAVTTGEDDR